MGYYINKALMPPINGFTSILETVSSPKGPLGNGNDSNIVHVGMLLRPSRLTLLPF
jgi:hypothetical protein